MCLYIEAGTDSSTSCYFLMCRCPMCNLNYQSEDQFVEHMVLQHTARLQETYTRLQGEVRETERGIVFFPLIVLV